MSDVRYTVEIAYVQSGVNNLGNSAATTKLKSLWKDLTKEGLGFGASLMNGVSGVLGNITDSLGGALASAAKYGGAALSVAIGKGVKEGLAFNDYMESSRIGMAGTMSMLGGVDFDEGMAKAAGTLEKLRAGAQDLPGTLKEAVNSFSSILPTGLNAGISTDRVTDMALKSVAVANALHISKAVAGHELAAVLEGRASSRMPLVARMGLNAKEMNKMSEEKRWAIIEEKFKKMQPAIDRYRTSWAGLSSALFDTVTNHLGALTTPLFEGMKKSMWRAQKWFGANDTAITDWTSIFGGKLERAFDAGQAAIARWKDPILSLAKQLEMAILSAFSVVKPYLERVESFLGNAAKNPDALGKALHGAGMLVGARAGASVAGSAMGAAPGLMKGLEMFGLEGASLAAVALPALAAGLVVVAAAAMGIEGAFSAATDAGSQFHGTVMGLIEQITTNGAELWKSLQELEQVTRPLREMLGVALLHVINQTVQALTFFVGAVTTQAKAVIDAAAWLADKLGIKLGSDPAAKNHLNYGQEMEHVGSIREVNNPDNLNKPKVHVDMRGAKIEIKVNSNQDPNRIAKRTKDVLLDAVRNPKTATLTGHPVWSR